MSGLRLGGATNAAGRAADALLRGVGGRAVLLRMPAPAVAGAMTEELGLAVPGFQDEVLAPVICRRLRQTGDVVELLVSASAVAGLTGVDSYGSAAALFASAAGVVIDDVLMEIEQMTSAGVMGVACVYRLQCRVPVVVRV